VGENMNLLSEKQIKHFKNYYEKDLSNIAKGIEYISRCLEKNKSHNDVTKAYICAIGDFSLIMETIMLEETYLSAKAFMHFYEVINEFLIYLKIREPKGVNQGDKIRDAIENVKRAKHDS
jgi:hypothetical protein